MFGSLRRGGRPAALPTVIHSIRGLVTQVEEPCGWKRCFTSGRHNRGGYAFSGGNHLCSGGTRRGGWGFAGNFPLRGAARRPAHQCHGGFRRIGLRARPSPSQARRKSVAKAVGTSFRTVEKSFGRRRNHPPTPPLIVRRRAKPPAPHPQSPGVEPRPFFAAGGQFFCLRFICF